jgi:hypothetical protein
MRDSSMIAVVLRLLGVGVTMSLTLPFIWLSLNFHCMLRDSSYTKLMDSATFSLKSVYALLVSQHPLYNAANACIYIIKAII